MVSRMWLAFSCVQAIGVVALRLGNDWLLILGVLLSFPGLPGLYLNPDIHRLLLIKDIWLTLAAIAINAVAWQTVKISIRRLRRLRKSG
jgi:hypothetical protein